MSHKVHADEGDNIQEFVENTNGVKNSDQIPLTKRDLEVFKKQIGDMCATIVAMNEKLNNVEEKNIKETKQTTWERIKDNTLRDMFIGHEVTSDDIDNVVSTLTLMNALILTIPYGIMSSADNQYWDWMEDTLKACVKTKFKYADNFVLFSDSFNAVVYCTIADLLIAMVYYLLRPKSDKKFRAWWKSARYVILMLLSGTAISVISLVAVSAWLFSWYMIPTSKLCTYSAASQTTTGVIVISVVFLLSIFLML